MDGYDGLFKLCPVFCYYTAHLWDKLWWIPPSCPQRSFSIFFFFFKFFDLILLPTCPMWGTSSPHVHKSICRVSQSNTILSTPWGSGTPNRLFLVRKKIFFFLRRNGTSVFLDVLPKKIRRNNKAICSKEFCSLTKFNLYEIIFNPILTSPSRKDWIQSLKSSASMARLFLFPRWTFHAQKNGKKYSVLISLGTVII